MLILSQCISFIPTSNLFASVANSKVYIDPPVENPWPATCPNMASGVDLGAGLHVRWANLFMRLLNALCTRETSHPPIAHYKDVGAYCCCVPCTLSVCKILVFVGGVFFV